MAAVGSEERLPTDAEMRTMKDHLDEALEAGVLHVYRVYTTRVAMQAQEITELAGQMRHRCRLRDPHAR